MSNSQEVYTYRGGQKISLTKRPDQFIVRALPDRLENLGITDAEQVSSASSRVISDTAELEQQMRDARQVAPTYHAYEVTETGEDFLITDRIFVTFREALTAEQVAEFAGRYGLLQKQMYSDRDHLFQLTNHTGMNPVKLVVRLMETEPQVELAEHDLNYAAKPYQITLPSDPSYRQQWHLHRQLTHGDFDSRASANCEAAWHLLGNFGSADVVVAVADDGCKLNHPDFDSATKFAGWGYFVSERLVRNVDIDANPANMYQTNSNHGTSCAGVIAAEIDASLTVGAAPGCRLLPIKWESSGASLFISDSKLLTAINYIADKADIMSNSWGSTPTSLWSVLVTRRLAALAQTGGRQGRGIIFLWAAGNENCPINHVASVDVPYDNGWEYRNGSWIWVGVSKTRTFQNNLVDIPGVVHVAALASTAQRSHYSNYGTGIGICAPSSNSHEYFRMNVRGLGITTTTGSSGLTTPDFGGTSSATPLVAGIAALVISANPDLSALDVIALLKRTASKDLNLQGYPKTPPANFDTQPTWDVSPIAPFDQGDFMDKGAPEGTWSPWFGHGRVDAAAAVAEALRLRQPSPQPAAKLSYKSTPAKTIPDNNATGIQDGIAVAEFGRLKDIQVTVNITHTWIGDLKVQLTAPNGTVVVLHNRTGSSQDNIQQTYTLLSTPTLATLKDSDISGNWILLVQDLASQDVGILQSWAIDLEVEAAPEITETPKAIQIPDFNPNGVVQSLIIPAGQIIQELAVSVDITHPQISDLRVTLIPPDGIPITLHDQTGGSTDNLVRTWRMQDSFNLRFLRGKDAGGTWQLRVADLTGHNVGKLNNWRLEVFT